MKFLIINGPNLNLLGKREPHIYGSDTLQDLEHMIKNKFEEHDFTFVQSNHEGVLLDAIHDCFGQKDTALIINAGAFTHTSVALRDALAAVQLPFIEVHISNTYAREEFRHHSYIAPLAKAVISGLGLYGYMAAIEYFIKNR